MITLTTISSDAYKKLSPLKIIYGFHQTPFGMCLVGVAEQGLCFLGFTEKTEEALKELHKNWPGAEIHEGVSPTAFLVQKIFTEKESNLSLFVKGTDFQLAVWKALLAIPKGTTVSYEQVAKNIGKPAAIRAAASAVGDNPISYLIPCHRVIRKSGYYHNYRWGVGIKKALLLQENVSGL